MTDRITFTGLVARDRIPDVVAAFDIALQPDVVAYASPLKLFEYMALGCAIVAPDVANIREILSDGKNAVLFNANDDAFRAAIERLSTDPALCARIGMAAKALVIDRPYSWDNNALIVETLFQELLDEQSR